MGTYLNKLRAIQSPFYKPQSLFARSGQYVEPWSGHLVVLGSTGSPTIDFYFHSRQQGVAHYLEIDTQSVSEHGSMAQNIPVGSVLVLIRDIPVATLKSLLPLVDRLAGVVWFIDDDIPGIAADHSLPQKYRKRLDQWYQKTHPLLSQLCDRVWVSTGFLAKKYNLPSDSIIPPIEPVKCKPQRAIHLFYHGTSSHQSDWQFVIEVARKIQARNSQTWFEFIGDHALYKACKGIPRVQILHPMQWPDYLAMTASRTMDIGLAPLADTTFNQARSHTKFLDICRQKAVGIYSRRFSNAEDIDQSGAGLVLGDSVEEWVAGIEYLMTTDRQKIYQQAEALRVRMHESSNNL